MGNENPGIFFGFEEKGAGGMDPVFVAWSLASTYIYYYYEHRRTSSNFSCNSSFYVHSSEKR